MESIINSKDKLHFFEYLQVDIFQQYLRTGIHYFLNALLDAHPAFVPLRYRSLEIATFIDFIKDFLYLKTYSATYAQNFFNFQRKTMGKLGALKGALIWTIIPYITQRIEILYNELVADQLEGRAIEKLKLFFVKIYPYIYMLAVLVQTVYKFLYLYNPKAEGQRYYHFLYHLNKTTLGHLPQAEQAKYPFLELLKKPGLLVVLLGHKVLTWYFGRKRNVNRSQDQVGSVPAQVLDKKAKAEQGLCAICTKAIKNPTLVRQTGYVYCWECIVDYVRKEQRCPLGGVKTSVESLQLVYL